MTKLNPPVPKPLHLWLLGSQGLGPGCWIPESLVVTDCKFMLLLPGRAQKDVFHFQVYHVALC